jgi:hypothetical protein
MNRSHFVSTILYREIKLRWSEWGSHPCARPGSPAHELGALGWSKKAQGWGTAFLEKDARARAESRSNFGQRAGSRSKVGAPSFPCSLRKGWEAISLRWSKAMKQTMTAVFLLALVAPFALEVSSQSPASPSGLYRIAGTVVNAPTGEPVRRATVAVLSVANSRILQSVLSGEDGRFTFTGLPAAMYQLTASKRGFRTAFYDQHEEYNSAVVTGEGLETENLVFRLSSGAVLHGEVTSDGGDPMEAAKVMLFRKPRGHNPDERTVLVDSTSTDDSGSYEFANLAPGEYLMAVKAEPWYALHHSRDAAAQGTESRASSTLDLSYPVTYFDSTTEEASAALIILSAGSRTEANLSLHAVPSLHLSVPSNGKQVESALSVELRQIVFGTEIGSVSLSSQTDSKSIHDGEFGALAPGRYELQQGDPPRLLELEVAANQQIDPNAGAIATSVSGSLRNASGSAKVEEASLTLTPLETFGGFHELNATALKGKFSFAAVPSGTWLLSVVSAGKSWQVLSLAADGKSHPGNQLTVKDRALSLAVTVSEGATRVEGFARKDGKGMGGAMVVLVPENPGENLSLFRRDQSNTDGSFALVDVPPGQYKIVAIENGWDLDWARPEVIARYLPLGIAVTVDGNSGKLMRLAQPVAIQPR